MPDVRDPPCALAYRGFILGSIKREFQSKYRNSLLGAAWTVLNPLAMIVVYTVIFSEVMRARFPAWTIPLGTAFTSVRVF
jgi:ABC-type polysaccharide/polyol phosphate export permease